MRLGFIRESFKENFASNRTTGNMQDGNSINAF